MQPLQFVYFSNLLLLSRFPHPQHPNQQHIMLNRRRAHRRLVGMSLLAQRRIDDEIDRARGNQIHRRLPWLEGFGKGRLFFCYNAHIDIFMNGR